MKPFNLIDHSNYFKMVSSLNFQIRDLDEQVKFYYSLPSDQFLKKEQILSEVLETALVSYNNLLGSSSVFPKGREEEYEKFLDVMNEYIYFSRSTKKSHSTSLNIKEPTNANKKKKRPKETETVIEQTDPFLLF